MADLATKPLHLLTDDELWIEIGRAGPDNARSLPFQLEQQRRTLEQQGRDVRTLVNLALVVVGASVVGAVAWAILIFAA